MNEHYKELYNKLKYNINNSELIKLFKDNFKDIDLKIYLDILLIYSISLNFFEIKYNYELNEKEELNEFNNFDNEKNYKINNNENNKNYQINNDKNINITIIDNKINDKIINEFLLILLNDLKKFDLIIINEIVNINNKLNLILTKTCCEN
jgi:hypothetical protein